MTSLALDKICLDGGTQSRASLNDTAIEDYAQIIRDGTDFPPVVVFYDGKKYWLADGFHRVAAYGAAGAIDIAADIRQGDRRDAILFSVGANAAHGLRRTNEDKRRAVMTLLNDKEWSGWSDRQIAKQCGVSHNFVSTMRPSLSSDDSEPRTFTTKHGTAAKMATARIGKSQRSPATEQEGFDLYAINDRTPAKDSGEAPTSAQDEVASRLRPEVQAMRAATVERKKAKPIAAMTAPVVADDDIDELRNTITAQQEEIDDLRRTVAKFDGMAAEYEKGGFEEVIAGLKERINVLSRQVERESQEKVKNLRAVAYWKDKALAAGADADISIDLDTGEMTRE